MSAATADVVAPRLDLWLADSRQITRHAARTLIDAGLVTVDGRPGRPGQRVRDTADVVVTPPDETLVAAATPRRDPGIPGLELRIVDEDDWLAVVDKPSGMVVHPAPGHPTGTLADALKERGTTWSLLGGAERAGIVHRLDRDTSGLLVVAKTEAAHRNLARQLSDRSLGRTYWALVHGGFREDTGTIDAPIARHPRDRRRMAIVEGGREAMTDFRVVERLAGATVLELSLRTGRTHQIRVHLASIGHPIVGDTVYGRPDPLLPRPALHAMRLRLRHPADGTERTYESPVPEELIAAAARLRPASE
jgi:23S rRNA pseudouridine1911/1915/1917 synthase